MNNIYSVNVNGYLLAHSLDRIRDLRKTKDVN